MSYKTIEKENHPIDHKEREPFPWAWFIPFMACVLLLLLNFLDKREPIDSFFLHAPDQVYVAMTYETPAILEEGPKRVGQDIIDDQGIDSSIESPAVFHFNPCCSELASLCKNRPNRNELKQGEPYIMKMAITEARKQGYLTPCSKCWPPEFNPLTGASLL